MPIASSLSTALADRYQIERELGEGGMATVYLAHDVKHDRKVALKVLRPELAAVIGAERFLSEIKTTANLQHPHILPLHDSGEVDGTVFYVMPFVEGETLRDRLDKEKQLPVNDAVRIATEIAGALDYAHRHGVIHRDIKPENILLHDGRAMVADFGIALAASRTEGDSRLTESGMSLGTPHYMSPEQAMGEREIDARTDIYAIGSVLYEMLAGEPPFTGPTVQSIVAKVLSSDPEPITTYRKTTPPNVVAAVQTALQKLPADRFATAAKFAEMLADSSAGPTTPAGVAGGAPHRSKLVVPLAIVAVVMTAVAIWSVTRATPAPAVSRYALGLPPSQAPDPTNLVVPTADGSRIVYVGPGEATPRQLWVKDRDKHSARPLAGTDGVVNFAVSPDGAWVAFHGGGQMIKVPIDGGAGTTVVEAGVAGRVGGMTWLDDGTIVYVMTGGGRRLARVSDQGGASTVIWESDSLSFDALQPLPNARGLLFQVCPAPCAESAIWVLDFETGEAQEVVAGASVAQYLSTGHLAFTRGTGPMFALPFDLASLEVRGTPVALLDSVASVGNVPLVMFSASGTLVMRSGAAVNQQEFEFVWIDQEGRVTQVDSTDTFRHITVAANYGWALSPDETQVAIGLATAAGEDIWVKSLPRGPRMRVSFGEDTEYRPRWMPDGKSIIFASRGEAEGVFYRRADGTGDDVLVAEGLFDEAAASPDGRWFVFRSGALSAASGGRDLLVIEVGVDSVPRPLLATQYDEMAFSISPDGRAIVYQSDEQGRIDVFIRHFPDVNAGRLQVSAAGGTGALWSRDGREVYYRNLNSEMVAVPVTVGTTLRAGEPRVLFEIPSDVAVIDANFYTAWDVASDGRFLMTRSIATPSQFEAPLIVVENWFEEVKAKLGNE